MNEIRNELLTIMHLGLIKDKDDQRYQMEYLLERFEIDIKRQLEDIEYKKKELENNLETLKYVKEKLEIK